MSKMLMERAIVYFNISSFAIEVERSSEPALRGRPVVIAPSYSDRAQVWEVSTEAFNAGLRKGMPVSVARKKCRDLRLIEPKPDLYERANRQLERRIGEVTPVYEFDKPGHVYLDLTWCRRLYPNLEDAATHLQGELQRRWHWLAAVGIAVNKLVSKIAAKTVRTQAQIRNVPPTAADGFLHPLPVSRLPLVKQLQTQRAYGEDLFSELNLLTVADLAALEPAALALVFGRWAEPLWRMARGLDDSPVLPPQEELTVREELLLEVDSNDDELLLNQLFRLIEKAAFRLREVGAWSGKVTLTVRYADFRLVSGVEQVEPPAQHTPAFFPALALLYRRLVQRRVRLRFLGLAFSGLKFTRQLSLFGPSRQEQLTERLDLLKQRYGGDVVLHARELGLLCKNA